MQTTKVMKTSDLTRAQWWLLIEATDGVRAVQKSRPALRLVALGLAHWLRHEYLMATDKGNDALRNLGQSRCRGGE